MPGYETAIDSKAQSAAVSDSPHPLVALVGSPNCGKTTLFNALTGLNYRTVNYPGATVDYAIGHSKLATQDIRVMDLPGIASLNPHSHDEEVALKALFGHSPHGAPSAYVAIVDATQLERHLYNVRQLLEAGCRIVVAVTMVDILEKRKRMTFDIAALAKELGCPVVRVDGRTGLGLSELREELDQLIQQAIPHRLDMPKPRTFHEILHHYRSIKEMSSRVIQVLHAPSPLERLRALVMPDSLTVQMDRIFLHPVFGILVFAAMMMLIFTSIFWLAQPMMDVVDGAFAFLATQIAAILPASWFTALLTDGAIMGVGAVAVFIPQIVILFFAMGLLEDSGYLSRGAMIVDRPLAAVGLSGRAFVPILSGFACAIPAMMSARTIPSRRERYLTIFIMPLMLCSARLPVYGLLLSFLVPPGKAWLGGLGLTALYFLSVTSGLVGAAILGRIIGIKKVDSSLLLELPAIRLPKLRVVLTATYQRTKTYLQRAGGTILLIAVLLWVLTHYPPHPDLSESEQLANSYAATLGRWMEPLMHPLGLDWRVGVALICGFAAREVFVSALALVLMVSGGGEALQEPLLLAMREATTAGGAPLFTLSTCAGLIVFFIFAMQCMATLVVSRRETGGWRIPLLQLTVLTSVAYVAAVIVVQGLRLLGIP